MARKRAPGGGRKPKEGRASPLSLRMPDEMRAALEASAAKRKPGKSGLLSEEILHRLRLSFVRERDERRDPASTALCRLLTEVILAVANSTVGPQDWRSDPWAFEAVRLAFDQILLRLKPPGEMRAPATRQGVWAAGTIPVRFQLGEGTPEEMAHFVSDVILMRPTFEAPFEVSRFEENREYSTGGNAFEYTMADAFKALKLKEPNQ